MLQLQVLIVIILTNLY